MILCKDCKFLVWYQWSFPYGMDMEICTTQECYNKNNGELDPVTGEIVQITKSVGQSVATMKYPSELNKDCDCSWFEAGRHKRNCGGDFEPGRTPKEEHPYFYAVQNTPKKLKRWQAKAMLDSHFGR